MVHNQSLERNRARPEIRALGQKAHAYSHAIARATRTKQRIAEEHLKINSDYFVVPFLIVY